MSNSNDPHLQNVTANNIFVQQATAANNLNVTNATPVWDWYVEPQGREIMASITKRHSKGFFYQISVRSNDDVFYTVYDGGWIAYLMFKYIGWVPQTLCGLSKPPTAVLQRTHLAATIGAAYTEIDQTVEKLKEQDEKAKHALGLLKAKPENLKMIGELERLQEGEPGNASQPTNGYQTYSTTFTVAGNGTYSPQSVEQTIKGHISKAVAAHTDQLMMTLLKDGMGDSKKDH